VTNEDNQQDNKQDNEQKTVKKVYGALAASLLMAAIPHILAVMAVIVLFMGTLIAAYIIRKKSMPDSFSFSHMTYIIRTIWISSFIGTLSTLAATIYTLPLVDNEPIYNCIDSLPSSFADINIDECATKFIDANLSVFITGTIIAAAPIVIYTLWRLYKGGSHALKGLPITKPKSWI